MTHGIAAVNRSAVIAITADRPNWQRLRPAKEAGNRLEALRMPAADLATHLSFDLVSLDLGPLEVETPSDRAQLAAAPVVSVI